MKKLLKNLNLDIVQEIKSSLTNEANKQIIL